ncbi:MAG: molybdopterin-dependent oxidoreductase [Chloroflexota bacterium]|nr:molybdopterin-dependent oxidoreductase [Chloroflexota bacterium]
MKQEPDRLQAGESSTLGSQDNNRIEKPKKKKSGRLLVSRRAFLGVSAAATAALTAGYALKRPGANLIAPPDNIYEETTEEWFATSCLNCPTRCATRVRVQNGNAVRITSNPLSKVSDGKTCPRSRIGLQVLYDPERIQNPMKRKNSQKGKGVDPEWEAISWTQALSEISNNLKSLRDSGTPQKLAIFQGLNSNSVEDMIARFAKAFGTPNVITGDALDDEASKAGEWMADGHYTLSAYDLEKTNYILSFGAGIIESQKPLARNLRMWGKIRRERPNRAKVVVIDPRCSVTAAKADQWIAIKPGTDAALAMAIANVIISEGLYDSDFVSQWTHGFEEYKNLALNSKYSPESASSITGIDADVIRQIAREFADTSPAIAWRGRGATCWPNGSYASYAIFCLNALVGSIDVPGGVTYQQYPEYKEMPEVTEDSVAQAGNAKDAIDLRKKGKFLAANMVTNQAADSIIDGSPYAIEFAIGFNSNFNMAAPGTARWDEAMAKVPFYVHVSPSFTEMSEYADIVLPACSLLEDWAYEHCPPGSGFTEVKIKQPVVSPLHESKTIGDIIFALAYQIGDGVAQSFEDIGDSAEGFVRYRTESLISWNDFRENGVWIGPDYEFYKYDTIFDTPSKKFEFRSGNLEALLKASGYGTVATEDCLPQYKEPEFGGDESSYPLNLVTYQPVMNVANGSQNYPWAQEIYLVMHGYGWMNLIEVNEDTAHENGFKDKDVVWVESPFGKIQARARVFQGIHPEVVAIAQGQGHYADGEWADGIGVNPNDIIGVYYDELSGQSSLFNTRVRVYKA